VEAVRPARCVVCGLEGAVPARALGLHGHGTRTRLQLGPPGLYGPPEETLLTVRRYQCRRCSAVLVVAPRDVLPFLRYRARAVVMALAYLADGQASPWIRQRVSAQKILGDEGRRCWRCPARWAVRAAALWPQIRAGPGGDARALALTAVRALASRAPCPTGRLVDDAVSALG